MQLNIDPDDAVREIGIIVSLAMQADGLEPVAARCLHADIASRLARLQASLLASEGQLRFQGYGHCDVPAALDAIERTRQTLLGMQDWLAEQVV